MKVKITIALAVVLVLLSTTNAQLFTVGWEKTYGGTGYEIGWSVQ